MLEHLLFWCLIGAVALFFRLTAPRQRYEWGRFLAGLLLLISCATLVYDLIWLPLTRR